MALSATALAVNASTDALAAAMEAHIESLSANDQIQIVFSDGSGSAWKLDFSSVADDSAFKHGLKSIIRASFGVADPAAIPMSANGKPLYWKLTNTAGDM